MTLVSSVDLKKADGSPLKVNFQFENGLPVKPIIAPVYSFGIYKKDKKPIFTIKLTEEQETIFKNEKVNEIIYEKPNNSLVCWLIFDNFYVFLSDITYEFKTFYLVISDHNNNYLKRSLVNGN